MSVKKEYVKLWLSYETYFQSYTPEEVGHLVLAMLRYKDTGEEPVFQGPERFIWPAVRRDINEARDAQEAAAERARENGRNGGRPRKLPAEENPAGFLETQETAWTKDKEKGQGQGQGQGVPGEGRGGSPSLCRGGEEFPDGAVLPVRRDTDGLDRLLFQLCREQAEGASPPGESGSL